MYYIRPFQNLAMSTCSRAKTRTWGEIPVNTGETVAKSYGRVGGSQKKSIFLSLMQITKSWKFECL